jgi:nitroimidazol reductase NimA-like FMN-containing flavoprotein (pyridoxamine 5'-phosphate oxidase superfamily)
MLILTNGHTPAPLAEPLSDDVCRAILERTCFGHFAFARNGHVDAVPIRFAFLEGWLYFRADAAMRADIRHNHWAVMSVVDRLDSTHFASVVARGTCYATEDTGSAQGDAAALRGILRLRDRVPEPIARPRRDSRTSIVFRLHVDALHGSTTFVPCPAGGEDFSWAPPSHAARPAESSDEDARADDDGMREPRADRRPSGNALVEAT